LLQAAGGGSPGWLVEPKLGMIAVIFVGVWVHLGFYSIILLAGLQGIDRSLLEAAAMDGATRFQIIRTIILPLLKPTTLVILILATIHGFQSFDFIYTLTGGGPLGATTLIVQYIYDRAFQTPIQYGLGSAAGVILFMIIFAFTALNFLLGRKREAI
jgi:ABC-type sugar transport system permease subunit